MEAFLHLRSLVLTVTLLLEVKKYISDLIISGKKYPTYISSESVVLKFN